MSAETQKLEVIQLILALQDYQVLDKIEKLLKKQSAPANGSTENPLNEQKGKKRQYGFAKGMTKYIAPDFNETPPGFEEYMQRSS